MAVQQQLPRALSLVRARSVLLVASRRGTDRRSTAFVRHVLASDGDGVRSFAFAPQGRLGEPSVAAAEAGASAVRRLGGDAIVAVGGGALLDMAKGISHLSRKPLIGIPTVPCAGSESSSYARLVDWDTDNVVDLKSAKPAAVILDSELAMMDNIDWPTVATSAVYTTLSAFCAACTNRASSQKLALGIAPVVSALRGKDSKAVLSSGMKLSHQVGLHAPRSESWHDALVAGVCSRVPLARSQVFNALFEPFFHLSFKRNPLTKQIAMECFGESWPSAIEFLLREAEVPPNRLVGLGQNLVSVEDHSISIADEFEEMATLALARYTGTEEALSREELVEILGGSSLTKIM